LDEDPPVATPRASLARVVAALEDAYADPALPPVRGAFELVLWENVVYLADDARRAAAFGELARRVGTTPAAVRAAPEKALLAATRHGRMAEQQARKLRLSAELALEAFGGDLATQLHRPLPESRRALTRFPAIGEPGAEKILLLTRSHPVLALDSNGLRVLQRLGFGEVRKSYAASYREAQAAATAGAPRGVEFLVRAHGLLRRHGQERCKASRPRCDACPLRAVCRYFAGARARPA
jgi:endonuclease III